MCASVCVKRRGYRKGSDQDRKVVLKKKRRQREKRGWTEGVKREKFGIQRMTYDYCPYRMKKIWLKKVKKKPQHPKAKNSYSNECFQFCTCVSYCT